MLADNDSQQPKPQFPVSRRNVIIGGASTTGLLATSGAVSAATDDNDANVLNPSGSSKYCRLTIHITGLEVEGAMADVLVENGTEQVMTDTNGTAVFELEAGTYEVTISKDGWGTKTRTIELGGQDQELHIPMHASQFNGLELSVCDASHGGPIKDAVITISGYGTAYTDEDGAALVIIEQMMEPTHHELTVTADGYCTETRQMTLDDDKHLRLELLPE